MFSFRDGQIRPYRHPRTLQGFSIFAQLMLAPPVNPRQISPSLLLDLRRQTSVVMLLLTPAPSDSLAPINPVHQLFSRVARQHQGTQYLAFTDSSDETLWAFYAPKIVYNI